MTLYPGLGLDLHYLNEQDDTLDLPPYPIGIYGDNTENISEMLLMREVAMMVVMDRAMDQPDWHRKVLDMEFVAEWTLEMLARHDGRLQDPLYDQIVATEDLGRFIYPGRRSKGLLDNGCLIYCVKELQEKARFFEKAGLVPTLDAYATVIKTDTLVSEALGRSLHQAFNRLREDIESYPRPGSNVSVTVRDLVDPALFPLVYGPSRVFQEEVVGVADAIDTWAGTGTVNPRPQSSYPVNDNFMNYSHEVRSCYWSEAYQWLPANIRFEADGAVKFTSYINNLDPVRYRDIYDTIERLVGAALPAWDYCVSAFNRERLGPGRSEARFPMPRRPSDGNSKNWDPPVAQEPPPNAARYQSPEGNSCSDSEDNGYTQRKRRYWKKTRKAVQPPAPTYTPVDYSIKPEQTLRAQFASRGLQVFVRMRTVELTPENPTLSEVPWHVEGNMNEHIAGTAIYYLESENVSTPSLSFRMETLADQYELAERMSQGGSGWAEQAYGVGLDESSGSMGVQNYGSVEVREGRLLAFPNVFHTHLSSCGLVDKTKPGRQKFVVLWLVDPLTRIISTANVPPQRADWWLRGAFGEWFGEAGPSRGSVPPEIAQLVLEKTGGGDMGDALRKLSLGERRLPPEVMDMIREELGDGLPMSWEEAEDHLERLNADTEGIQLCTEKAWRHMDYGFR